MATLDFVDKIDAAPTTRLNLIDGTKWHLVSTDFSPPPLRRAVVSTLLRDGAEIPVSAYDNRVVRLKLELRETTKDLLATELQKFNRELDRPRNVLRWKAAGAGAGKEVFFRTFRSPDYELDIDVDTNRCLIELELLAEPFAYGLKETATGVTVSRDPAGGNYFEINAAQAKGDVPSPLWLRFDGSTALNKVLLASRTFTTAQLFLRQCESWTQVVGASALDANASGGNVHEITTDPAGSLTGEWVGFPHPLGTVGSSVDYRGTFRIFVRARVTSGTFTLRARIPIASADIGDRVTIDATTFRIYDLGLATLPGGPDPVYDGYSNSELPVRTHTLDFYADRTVGTGALRLDYCFACPADEALSVVDWSDLGNDADQKAVYDGPNDVVYVQNISGPAVHTAGGLSAERTGSLPLVNPNRSNFYFILDDLDANSIVGSYTVTWIYWPGWFYIRP